jgi:hypothetical protein
VTRHRAWRSCWSVVCGLVLAASVFAGCSSARVGLGTTDESCYLELPTAATAVGHHGHLEGIRKYTVSGLKGVAPRLYGFLIQHVPKTQAVCLAGYSGAFTQGMVMKPQGQPAGMLAVVVVTSPGNKLLATVVLTKLPVRFRHTNPF